MSCLLVCTVKDGSLVSEPAPKITISLSETYTHEVKWFPVEGTRIYADNYFQQEYSCVVKENIEPLPYSVCVYQIEGMAFERFKQDYQGEYRVEREDGCSKRLDANFCPVRLNLTVFNGIITSTAWF